MYTHIVYVCVCARTCVCVRKRDTETETERDREQLNCRFTCLNFLRQKLNFRPFHFTDYRRTTGMLYQISVDATTLLRAQQGIPFFGPNHPLHNNRSSGSSSKQKGLTERAGSLLGAEGFSTKEFPEGSSTTMVKGSSLSAPALISVSRAMTWAIFAATCMEGETKHMTDIFQEWFNKAPNYT